MPPFRSARAREVRVQQGDDVFDRALSLCDNFHLPGSV